MTYTETPSTNGAPAPSMQIAELPASTITVPIIGTSPLIMHRFSKKAKQQMLDNMQGRKAQKTNKDPVAECEAALYRLENGDPGFPAVGFKLATVSAARFYGSSVTMASLKQSMFFTGMPGDDGQALVPIVGDWELREDVVRVGRGGTDLRYRPQFSEWSTSLTITFVTTMLDQPSLLSLIDAGGLGVGVGEWRPERDGDFGTFRIDPDGEVEVRR